MKDKLFIVEFNRMPGIIAALITDNDVAFLGQDIDNLAFALIAPLGADQDAIHREEQGKTRGNMEEQERESGIITESNVFSKFPIVFVCEETLITYQINISF